MSILMKFADMILHLDKYLDAWAQDFGIWLYAILFLIIFAETGFVVTPFLPGDSLLFAIGAISARGLLDPVLITFLLLLAAISGDAVNYTIGKYAGHKLVQFRKGKFIKQKHLDKTHAYFEKYGGKTIVLARFVPIVRTFAPFVAGIATMTYRKFFIFNITGAILWILSFIILGYFFGNLPLVKKNFSLVIFAIVLISIMPMLYELFMTKQKSRRERKAALAGDGK